MRCRPARFFWTKGAPDAETLLGGCGVSASGVAPGSSAAAGVTAGGVMIAGVLLSGCCMRTELASTSACRAAQQIDDRICSEVPVLLDELLPRLQPP